MLPLDVRPNLPAEYKDRWKRQFEDPGKTALQSIWRRNQFDWNSDLSGWKGEGDARRRLLHYRDVYGVKDGNQGVDLVITEPYLWVSTALPQQEVSQYEQEVQKALGTGGWDERHAGTSPRRYEKQGVVFEYQILDEHPQDIKAGRSFPRGYSHFDATFRVETPTITQQEQDLPWGVVGAAYRQLEEREEPQKVSDLRELEPFFPMQVELGCGPSVETGIPALHYLHEVYRVMERDKRFIFGAPRDDILREVLAETETFYKKAGLIYDRALTAQLTPFYHLLQRLHSNGTVVGDVITNSIDNLCLAAGLPELNVRRYERSKLVPEIPFHEDAKSLLVVGSHADRRLVRKAARTQGLQVIYVDPEGYMEDGRFVPAPMEAPKHEDLHVPLTAQQFYDSWTQTFGTP